MKIDLRMCNRCGLIEVQSYGKPLYTQDSWSKLDFKITERMPNEELHWDLCPQCTKLEESFLAARGEK